MPTYVLRLTENGEGYVSVLCPRVKKLPVLQWVHHTQHTLIVAHRISRLHISYKQRERIIVNGVAIIQDGGRRRLTTGVEWGVYLVEYHPRIRGIPPGDEILLPKRPRGDGAVQSSCRAVVCRGRLD